MNKNWGMNVKITFKKDSPFGECTEIYHNVTEIHYLYDSPDPMKRVAFESDIHGTGITQPVDYIKEFEAVASNLKEEGF